jgi:hypothetical protein
VLRVVGWVCTAIATATFVLAGLGLLGVPGLGGTWQLFAATGGLVSLLMLGLFWHRNFVVGLLLDVAILLAIYFGWVA